MSAVLWNKFLSLITRSERLSVAKAYRKNISVEPGPEPKTRWVIFENYQMADFVRCLETEYRKGPAFESLASNYGAPRKFPDLGDFRLGPNLFRDTVLDWIVLVSDESGKPELIGHGVTTQLVWDGTPAGLPTGWQDSVRRSYENVIAGERPNSLVGLFIFVQDEFRSKAWAGKIAEQMKRLAGRKGLAHLIIPLRPPAYYQKEYATMPFAEFAALKREDGQYVDHWVRLHTRLGAKVLGISETSHQYAMSLRDFNLMLDPRPVERTGYRLIEQVDGWYNVYLDKEHQFALMNQGCVWVRHDVIKA